MQGHTEVRMMLTGPATYREFTIKSLSYNTKGIEFIHPDGRHEVIDHSRIHWMFSYSNH